MTAYRMQIVFKCSFSIKDLNRITQQLDGGKLIVNNAKELVLTQTLAVVPTEELIHKYEEAIRTSWPETSDLCLESVKFDRYITKYTRVELLKLEKTHTNDALAIAQGRRGFGVKELTVIPQSDYIYHIRPVRHHNRQLHKATILPGGIRKSNQAPRYVRGFRLFDKVSYLGEDCFIWGRRNSGSFLLKLLDGTKVKDGVSCKHISILERSTNYLIS